MSTNTKTPAYTAESLAVSAKHTPAPWRVDTQVGVMGAEIHAGSGRYPVRIASTCSGPDEDANARLIAAAPELLAALQLFLKVGYGNSTDFAVQAEAYKAARAAIAKAVQS